MMLPKARIIHLARYIFYLDCHGNLGRQRLVPSQDPVCHYLGSKLKHLGMRQGAIGSSWAWWAPGSGRDWISGRTWTRGTGWAMSCHHRLVELPGLGVARIVLHSALLHLVDGVLKLLEIRLKNKANIISRNKLIIQ